ncbi:MAG: HEAT repeat domain-containing protein [Sphingobacteriia bacterium]
MNDPFEKFVSDHREAFDDRMPNVAILQRIQREMQNETKHETKIVRFTAFRLMAAASIIGIIIVAAFMLQKPSLSNSAVIVKNEAPIKKIEDPVLQEQRITKPFVSAPRFQAVKSTINKDKEQLFHLLSNDLSASERIAGATKAYLLKNPDKEIIDVLVKTMDNDPNSNVRLASLDALSKFYREPYVKNKLVKSLEKQKDPVVQIALIELLTTMKEASIVNELQKISNDANSIKAVKDQAYAGIQKLSL